MVGLKVGWGGGEEGIGNIETKTVSQTVKRGKKQNITQCKACGKINISNYVKNF